LTKLNTMEEIHTQKYTHNKVFAIDVTGSKINFIFYVSNLLLTLLIAR